MEEIAWGWQVVLGISAVVYFALGIIAGIVFMVDVSVDGFQNLRWNVLLVALLTLPLSIAVMVFCGIVLLAERIISVVWDWLDRTVFR